MTLALVRERPTRRIPLGLLAVTLAAAHLVTIGLVARHVLPQLHDALALSVNPAHALALETGLRRLMMLGLLLPPFPIAVVGLATLGWGWRRGTPFRVWFVIGLVPQVLEGFARMTTVMVAPPSLTPGDVMELPWRYSSGAAIILDLLQRDPPPAVAYWASVLTLGALLTLMCWARAAAPVGGRDGDDPDETGEGAGLALVVLGSAYVLVALLAQALAPVALPALLQLLG